jgi:hypothetical protein
LAWEFEAKSKSAGAPRQSAWRARDSGVGESHLGADGWIQEPTAQHGCIFGFSGFGLLDRASFSKVCSFVCVIFVSARSKGLPCEHFEVARRRALPNQTPLTLYKLTLPVLPDDDGLSEANMRACTRVSLSVLVRTHRHAGAPGARCMSAFRLFASCAQVAEERRLKPLRGFVEIFTLTMIALLLICGLKFGLFV